jgi:hypothetical protein
VVEGLPIWLVALVLAAAAPFCVSLLAAVLQWRVRRRTQDLIARALSTSGPKKNAQQDLR